MIRRQLETGDRVALVRLRGALVEDGVGEALAAAALTGDGDMDCDTGFTAHGQVTLRGASIAGRLTFKGAVLTASGIAALLSRLQCGELCLRTAQPIIGGIHLAQARVGTPRR